MTDQTPDLPDDQPEDLNQRHRQKMAKKKAIRDKIMAEKTAQKGLLIVTTGAGKGKSTAAFGMALRCVGHGMKVGVVQFIKGAMDTAEREVLSRFDDLVEFKAMGEGFTWETQDREKDLRAARAAWEQACIYLADPAIDLVILDELTYAFKYGWLELDAVLAAFAARPPHQHVIVTGRAAPEALVAAADTVTEMGMVKHAFQAGVAAMPGIEF